jgi:hypothetical protein
MTDLSEDFAIAQSLALMTRYAFDLKGITANELIEQWLNNYHANWVRLATIEALYLGRYKAVSVEQILNVWLRIGSPNCHFNHDFERLICRKLPRYLTEISEFYQENIQLSTNDLEANQSLELFPQETLNNTNPSYSGATQSTNDSEEIINAESSPENLQLSFQGDRREASSDKQESMVRSEVSLPSLPSTIDRTSENQHQAIVPANNHLVHRKIQPTPIHQFMPPLDCSDFYAKLKAFVCKSLDEQESISD